MKNQEIAKIFYEIADILEIEKVQWKPRAYRKAAKALESLNEDVEVLMKQGKLMDISGVGEGLAKKIEQYVKTGKIDEYERLKKTIPEGLDRLMEIPGMGPKKAEYLFEKLGIKTVAELEEAIKNKKLEGLKGYGKKTEDNLLKGIELYKKGTKRMLLGFALPTAREIINNLRSLKEVKDISTAGSLRRMAETIGDIDILITSSKPGPVMDFFTKMPAVDRVLAKGDTKSSVLLKNSIQVDIRIVDQKSFGAALQYFTGSKDHNVKLRQLAITKGFKLSEYGLFNRQTNKLVAGKSEPEVYKKLGCQFIEPELRENTGEIESAMKNKLPRLIGYDDIRGDLHTHSTYTDGVDSLKDMALAAKAIGYQYILITDHTRSLAIARGMDEAMITKQMKEIDALNRSFADSSRGENFIILKGAELNIDKDGKVDMPKKILSQLDIVLASVHSGFKMEKSQMTKRIISAMENVDVDIIAHPTGRMIQSRYPYELDIEKIMQAAKDTGTVLEIDAYPERLDLRDVDIRHAVESKVKLSIGSDSHSSEQLKFIELGIAQARRGWAKKSDIINTYSLEQLRKIIKK